MLPTPVSQRMALRLGEQHGRLSGARVLQHVGGHLRQGALPLVQLAEDDPPLGLAEVQERGVRCSRSLPDDAQDRLVEITQGHLARESASRPREGEEVEHNYTL